MKLVDGELVCDCKSKTFAVVDSGSKTDAKSLCKVICNTCGKEIDNDILLYTLGNFNEAKENINDLQNDVSKLLGDYKKVDKIKNSLREMRETLQDLDIIWTLPTGNMIGDMYKISDIILNNLPKNVSHTEPIIKTSDDAIKYEFELLTNDAKHKQICRITVNTNEVNNIFVDVNINGVGNKRFELPKSLKIYEVLTYINLKINY